MKLRDDGQVVKLTQSELALFIEGCTLLTVDRFHRLRSSENACSDRAV
jgi:hypothetical protein